jgi:hypothetical protein
VGLRVASGCGLPIIPVFAWSGYHLLPQLSWLEREAVNLKVGRSSLPGSAFLPNS